AGRECGHRLRGHLVRVVAPSRGPAVREPGPADPPEHLAIPDGQARRAGRRGPGRSGRAAGPACPAHGVALALSRSQADCARNTTDWRHSGARGTMTTTHRYSIVGEDTHVA